MSSPLGYNTAQSGTWASTFRTKICLPFQRRSHENECRIFLRNVFTHL